MKEIVFASNNPNKLKEIELLLPSNFFIKGLSSIGCTEEIPETQATIEGNALQKANYIYDKYQVNCFADDTGLEVNALNGRPGVYSARYAGEEKNAQNNMKKILTELSGNKNREALFKTVVALIWQGKQYLFEGIVTGVITEKMSGTAGFGYDPIFMPSGFARTFAEMNMQEKNQISHRARAVAKLVDFLKTLS